MCGPMKNPKVETRSRDTNLGPHDCKADALPHDHGHHTSVYINDIIEEIQSNINSFADDTCLSTVVGNPSAAGTILQNDINRIILWAVNGWLDLTHQSRNLL